MSFVVTKDEITPALRNMVDRCRDRQPVLEAMGEALVSVTKRAFNDPSLRPEAWAPIKNLNVDSAGRQRAANGKFQSSSALKKSGALWQSIRITELTGDHVTVGTDRPYAGFQQFGTKGPYTIRPKTKKALAWPGAAHPMKSVQHPGLPPRPFFPFSPEGQITDAALRRIQSVARAKLLAQMNQK